MSQRELARKTVTRQGTYDTEMQNLKKESERVDERQLQKKS